MRSKAASAGTVRGAQAAKQSAPATARVAASNKPIASPATSRAPRARRKFDEPADGFDPFATGSNVGDYLGRLDPSGEAPKPDTHVALADIRPFPGQPRRHFDPAAIDDLAASIEREGLINPLTVRPAPEGGGYQLLAGERRYRALSRLAARNGATTMRVPVVVKAVSDLQARAITARENLDREDLSRYETALAYRHVAEVLREERGEDPGYEVLADYIGRALGVVHEYMTIANRIDEAVLTRAGFADAEGRPDYGRISRLTKSALLKAAKAASDDTRLAVLAREAERITGSGPVGLARARRNAPPLETPQAVADRYYEEGGFRINLPGAFKKMLPQDAAKYLDAMLPALGCLVERAMSGEPERVFSRPAGRGYVVYVPVVDGEQPNALVEVAAQWLAAHAGGDETR
ncbi:MAG TPA: ParB/RepB/Spo0J family partition protein [Gemmatirosa sp.]